MMLSSLFLYALFDYGVVVIAAADDGIVSGWVQDPSNSRGTFSIISSCVLTLSLCVYTAMHLNVRPLRQLETTSWITTTVWVLMGILAPELVVFVAWRQFSSARALKNSITRLIKEGKSFTDSTGTSLLAASNDKSMSKPQHLEKPNFEWTAVHSAYAVMGGFVIDIDNDYLAQNEAFTSKYERLTLTARGVKFLAECGYLPNISKGEILDKSKEDNLAKFVSLLQALWMLAQILGRVFVGLPVTLLEVNTLAHVFCALIIFILWWSKPKSIDEPTKLRGNWLGPLAAYMYMSSQMSGWKSRKPGVLRKTWLEPEFSILGLNDPPDQLPAEKADFSTHSSNAITAAEIQSSVGTPVSETEPSLRMLKSMSISSFSARPLTDLTNDEQELPAICAFVNSRLEASSDLQPLRWSLAAKAVSRYKLKESRFQYHVSRSTKSKNKGKTELWLEPDCEELVVCYAANWPDNALLTDLSGFVLGIVVWGASMAYGALHAAAWNEYFPSNIERILWRIATLCIIGSGALWVLINSAARASKTVHNWWEKIEHLQASRLSILFVGSISAFCGMMYGTSRVYLVIEALISLRSLPSGAYDTPNWTNIFPHL